MLLMPNGPGTTVGACALREKLVAMHVPALHFLMSNMQQKKFDAVSIVETLESAFVSKLLSMPNGSGGTMEYRNLHGKLVAMHIPALQFPVGEHQQQKKPNDMSFMETPESGFVSRLLAMPNDPGITASLRALH